MRSQRKKEDRRSDILISSIIPLWNMARKNRRFRPYLKGKVDVTLPLVTVGSKKVVTASETGVLDESAWLSSVKAVWDMSDFTAVVGDGPVYAGVCHSDYTTTEIEEWIENALSWSRGDKIAQEVGKRLIRQVGIFQTPITTGGAVHLNDGKAITTKCGWQLITGDTVKVWAYNAGAGALTTGANVHVLGHANLWPSA